jgi:hypothetical protein
MELHDSFASGKAVFQQVGGDTYLGSLAKGSGSGDLYLLVNGTGTSASVSTVLKANGNVLIGTTTDNGTRLQVNGDSFFGSGNSDVNLTIPTNNSGLGYATQTGDFSGSVILGALATATDNGQFALGSSTHPIGPMATESSASSTHTLAINLNGNTYRLLMVQ